MKCFRGNTWIGGFINEKGDVFAVGGINEQRIIIRSLNSWNGVPTRNKITVDAPWFTQKLVQCCTGCPKISAPICFWNNF